MSRYVAVPSPILACQAVNCLPLCPNPARSCHFVAFPPLSRGGPQDKVAHSFITTSLTRTNVLGYTVTDSSISGLEPGGRHEPIARAPGVEILRLPAEGR